jgi:serine/threonine protein kinase
MASRHTYVHPEGTCLAAYDFDVRNPSTKLGEGASGVVVVGRQRRTGREVAIKVMVKDRLSDEDIAAVAVEVDAMSKLKGHPHVVELFDFFDEPTAFYLAIELVSGGELFTQLASGEAYTEVQARAAMHQMVEAIEWCHRHGVVHRDLKVRCCW